MSRPRPMCSYISLSTTTPPTSIPRSKPGWLVIDASTCILPPPVLPGLIWWNDFFRDLTQQAIVSGSFQSVRDLVEAIDTYLAHHNLRAKPYVWRANGTEVLRKINRAWEAAMAGL